MSSSTPVPSREKPVYPLRWTERAIASLNALPLPAPSVPHSRTVLLTATGRSGTTWLGRVLAAAEGYCLVTEPLNPKMPGMLNAGFTFDTYVPADEIWSKGKRILASYFSGRGVTVKLLHRNGLKSLSCRGLVVKSIRANRILPWIARNFDLQALILLVRHPCAVVSSQMAHLADRDPCWTDNIEYLRRRRPDLLSWAEGLQREEERRALTWALDLHAPLTSLGPKPWHTVTYEGMVADGDDALRRVYEAAALAPSPKAFARFRENSWQTRDLSVDHHKASTQQRLGVWRERLNARQISNILSVVERCGISGYDEKLFPDAGGPRVRE